MIRLFILFILMILFLYLFIKYYNRRCINLSTVLQIMKDEHPECVDEIDTIRSIVFAIDIMPPVFVLIGSALGIILFTYALYILEVIK